ncbi:MAG: hypothetical protein KIT31_39620 [Deltaproteobacteria bacterium]|nr:hypothetical protein [Deltaproteobacteria bacterium]
MGLFDKLKGKVKDAAAAMQPQQQQAAQQYQQQQHYHQPEPEPEPQFDLAGFDPIHDETSFFHAVLHMESEGQFGGTDESRAEICARFGIRDRSHWQLVKDSNYAMLVRKYGSIDEVSQQELNWRQGQMQHHMQSQMQQVAASGGFTSVEGVSLEAWAALNAAIVGGANHVDLLKGAGLDQGRWDRVNAEWNARMARDTTFAIATVYGNAFQAASKGRFGDYAREAAAARSQNRDPSCEPPIAWEQYYEILLEQKYADKRGVDPVESLRASGLSIVDWTDLGTFMGYYFHRTAGRFQAQYQEIHQRVEARVAAKYPGVDVDIQF